METLQPKLRFPDFDENWNIEPIGNYIELFSGIALKSEEITDDANGTPILRGINITEGFIRHTKEIDKYYLGNISKIEKYFVKEGDLVLGMDGSKVGKNVALIKKEDENSILIQIVARIRANENSDIRYIYQQIFSKRFHDYVDIVNTSSGIPHISSQQIKDFKIGFSTKKEQTKIANFLSSIDEKINLLKEKKSLLEDYKKGIMQKIFNQEIRFKDDNGNYFEDWGEVCLGEVAKLQGGFAFKSNEFKNVGIPIIRISNISNKNNFIDVNNLVYYDELSNDKNFVIQYGDLLIAMSGATTGKSCIYNLDKKGYLNQRVGLFKNISTKKLFYNFLVQYVFSVLFFKQLESVLVAGAQPNVSSSDIESFKLPLPSYTEQTKIANFLSAIDEKIELVSTQIEETQEYKKGLLQQMFI